MTAPVLFGLFLFALLFSSPGEASEFKLYPNIAVGEEYTDNVFLEPEHPQYDFITRIMPGLWTVYKAPFWDWDATYTYDYRYHTKTIVRAERTHVARVDTQIRIVPEFFFLDVKEDYKRVSLDLVRDFTEESHFLNQTDRNVFSANPSVKTALTSQTTVSIGYLYRNTWYKDARSIDTSEHWGYADLKHEISPRLSATGGVLYIKSENDDLPFIQEDARLGMIYEYGYGSSLSAAGGYSRFELDEEDWIGQAFWDVRMTHQYSTMTGVFEVGMTYLPDPLRVLRREDRYLAMVQKKMERTTLEASGEVREFRDAATNHLEFSRYRARGKLKHAISQKSTITGKLIVERLEDYTQRTFTSRYLTDIRFESVLLKDLTWELAYLYSNIYSPDIYFNNYTSNRLVVELRKTF